MKKHLLMIIWIICGVAPAAICLAERSYVTDDLQITLRTGPSTGNKIISMLTSNQSVEVIKTEGEWSYVRVPRRGDNDREGWVLSRYLSTRLPWPLKAVSLEKENNVLKEKLGRVEQELGELFRERGALSTNLKKNEAALNRLTSEHQTLKKGSQDYLKLKRKYEITGDALKSARTDIQRLNQENQELRSSQVNRWFATGALVLLCGLLIGLLVGRQQIKRQSTLYQ